VDIFVAASRNKFRFETTSGSLTVEDLWDLPLSDSRKTNLDNIARALNKEIKETESVESFVKPVSASSSETKAKFDLVLYIIKVKIEERDAAKARADKEATRQKIMGLIDRKKDEALAGKSAEELQALLSTM